MCPYVFSWSCCEGDFRSGFGGWYNFGVIGLNGVVIVGRVGAGNLDIRFVYLVNSAHDGSWLCVFGSDGWFDVYIVDDF